MSTNADKLFQTFARSGDPDALAGVFDQLAPRLLLLGLHLSVDRAAAEDLLQETFLTAIRDVASFDHDQPLLPWLSGILANRALEHRRRRARSIDARRVAMPTASTPVEQAQAEELTTHLARAIDRLPQQVREVLLLRLHHGMTSREIAHTLARSPDTVRTQIRRGLDALRRQLPKGLVAPAVVALEPGRALAAIKAEVITRVPILATGSTGGAGGTAGGTTGGAAGGTAGGAAGGTAGGTATVTSLVGAVLFTRSWLVVAVLVATSVAVAVVAWRPALLDRTAAADREVAAMGSVAGKRSAMAIDPPASRGGGEARRTVRVDDHVRAFPVLVGRCVDADTGAGIPGCTVSMFEPGTTGPVEHQLVRADVAGRLRFAWPRRPSSSLVLRFAADGYASERRVVPVAESVLEIDVGVVNLVRGCLVSGTVRDADGSPLAGTAIRVSSDTGAAQRWGLAGESVTTDLRGGFRCTGLLPPGELRVTCQDPHHRVESLSLERIPRGRPSLTVDVVIGAVEDILAGVVIDRRGQPIEGVVVTADAVVEGRRDSGTVRVGHAVSDALGRFTIFAKREHAGLLSLSVRQPDAWLSPGSAVQGVFRWGDRQLRIVLDRLDPIILAVVGGGSREPVREVEVQHSTGTLRTGKPDGCYRLALSAGAYDLFVRGPRNEGLGMTHVHLESPRDQGRQITVVLPATMRRKIRLQDPSGDAVVRSCIEVVQVAVGRELTIGAKLTDPGNHPGVPVSESAGIVLDKAWTDAAGEATIEIPGAAEQVRLLVTGAHRPLVYDKFRGTGQQPLVLVVDLGNLLRGRVEPVPRLGEFGSAVGLSFEFLDRQTDAPQPSMHRVPWMADGRFRVPDLVPGRYRIRVEQPNADAVRPDDVVRRYVLHPEYRITADPAELLLDLREVLRAWTPANLAVTLFRDGKPLASVRVSLLLRRAGRWGFIRTAEPLETDTRGALRVDGLVPGTYRIKVGNGLSAADMILVAGATTDSIQHLRPRTLHLRLLDATGQPRPGVRVIARHLDHDGDRRSRTDHAGRADLVDLPSGTWQVLMETAAYEALSREERAYAAAKRSGVRVLGTVRIAVEQRGATRDFAVPSPGG